MPNVRELAFESPPHLPPLHASPILESYDIETKRIASSDQLAAPIDERGVVDIFKTVELALSLVDSTYIWPRDEPKPDIHHFIWERDWYHPRHFSGSLIPRDYRDNISFHKGYLPRQLHEFIHATIAPPPVPDFSVMQTRLEAYESAKLLFESARNAVSVGRKPQKLKGVPSSIETGEITLDEEILMQIIDNFQGYFETSKTNVRGDNEFMRGMEIQNLPPEVLATQLGKIAARGSINLMSHVYGKRRAA